MIIKSADFLMSNQVVDKCPTPRLPEYAFIGRSNVGKSSLINMLTNRKALAKTSSTPGKTQLINHFTINENWWLVDLPGYGYAKLSKKQRAKFGPLISNYLLQRENLMCTFVLLDIRHAPQKVDLEFMSWLAEKQLPFVMAFTKSDKLGKVVLQKNLAAYKKEMLEYWEELPPLFVTSAETKMGCDEVLDFIDKHNPSFVMPEKKPKKKPQEPEY